MRKEYKILFLFFLFLVSTKTFSQEREVTGQVVDQTGMPIPGVSVYIKGTTQGTVTNFDGEFVLPVEGTDNVIVFSYIGFETKEVLLGNQKEIDVILSSDVESLNEIVVTALGIKREKKALGYAVQSVESEELMEGNNSNIVSGLQGKVSGVTVANSGGAPGSSAAILIRGGTSITGNNQPLFVVDGIPIDNSTSSSLEVASTNRAADINPEDIESISILKGPAAAALYGIQAAEGAVIITTKDGRPGEGVVTYSGSFSYDEVIGTPAIQEVYGQGNQIETETGITYDLNSAFSWGEELEAGVETFNHIEDFYTPAITQDHYLSYSGGSEETLVFLSVGDLSQDGVIEGTDYNKTTFLLKASSALSDDFIVGGSVNYIVTETNSTKQGNATGGSYGSLLSYPINVDIHNFIDEDGSQERFFEDQMFDNPYWSLLNSPNINEVNRLIANININYEFLDNFSLSYKLGTDYYNDFNKRIIGSGSLIENREEGYISQFEKTHTLTTSNLILSYYNNITEDFSVDALVGNTVEDLNIQTVYLYGDGFQAPGIYSIGNVLQENQLISEVIARKRLIGLFGQLKLGWKDALFLSATGRNDWSSTLPEGKRSFFYPSVGVSAIISELFEIGGSDITSDEGLTYLQLRSTWAQVGKDAPIGALESSLGTNINGLASSAYTYNGVNVGNPNLEPEFTESYEIGVDARFFRNRVRLDASYYYSESENQILRDIRVPPSAGTFYATLNGGAIVNEGIGALLSVRLMPIESRFQWNLDLNYGMNDSRVIDLPGQLNEVYLSDSWTFNNSAAGAAILDGSLFGLRGYRPVRNENGEIVVNTSGLPSLDAAVFEDVNRIPDWTLGISSTVSYERLSLSFLFDIAQGQEVYNATESALVYYGLSPITLDRDEAIVIEGVDNEGNPNTVEITKNQAYYQDYYSRNAENFIEDGSYTKLRYVTLAYELPEYLLERISVNNARLYVTGRNLLTITDYSGVDPEVNTFGAGIAGAGSIGIDNLGTPNTMGIDVGLKFQF